jgi:uncharacterized protein
MFLQVGYGLEGALPDALAKQIIENEITPRFKQGDYDGGLTAGVNAILAATRGEYKGAGQTVAERNRLHPVGVLGGLGIFGLIVLVFLGFMVLIVLIAFSQGRRGPPGTTYSRRGYGPLWGGALGGWSAGGGWSGGGGSGGGGGGGGIGGGFSGGGFSGGGGSFGGGGAGGSW